MMTLSSLIKPWEQWALDTPNQEAILDLLHQERWTYQDLKTKAEALALEWSSYHLKPRSRIALTLEASGTFIAAIWAAWQLGFVWAPIPPHTPTLRAQYQLDLFDPSLVFDGENTAQRNPVHPPCEAEAAYLFFTSGSTGMPKGVLVGWKGLPILWTEQMKAFEVDTQSRATWMLSAAFDASLSDIGVALSAGATLVISSASYWKHVKTWIQDVEQYHISHIDIPPSLLALWAKHHQRSFPQGIPSSLKTLIVGGEASPQDSIDFWASQVRWVNVYGPTEATVCTSLNRLHPGQGQGSLGHPLSGISYRVLPLDATDPSLSEVLEGELWIGGDAVALEYWQNPMLSQERFFKDNQGMRWFKTGDYVQKVSTHEWVWQGRVDRQVKRHGQLLHLDEVEQVFKSLPQVSDAVIFVDAKQDLVVTLPSSLEGEKMILDSQIKLLLPSWGQPQHWWFTKVWPTTLSGKPDRQQLQAWWEKP